MREYNLIEKIIKDFPHSSLQRNRFMSCDAEIVEVNGQLLALTIDDFSPEEDLFTADNPEVLGHNLVVATISDLLAAGANPLFFLQALTLRKDIEESFLSPFTSGIRKALIAANCYLCGGDLSTSNNWRFTGCALGILPANKFIQRILPDVPQTLWVTGELGDANFAILNKTQTPKFELRIQEAKLIQKYATACIDTSSGLFDAIYCLSQQRPAHEISIRLDKIPFARGSREFLQKVNIPQEVVLVGGAGEYELLFSTPVSLSDSVKQQFIDLGITSIGTANLNIDHPGIFVGTGKNFIKVEQSPPCPREAVTLEQYFEQVLTFTKRFLTN
jgi:thiamine-monophosphate kinase